MMYFANVACTLWGGFHKSNNKKTLIPHESTEESAAFCLQGRCSQRTLGNNLNRYSCALNWWLPANADPSSNMAFTPPYPVYLPCLLPRIVRMYLPRGDCQTGCAAITHHVGRWHQALLPSNTSTVFQHNGTSQNGTCTQKLHNWQKWPIWVTQKSFNHIKLL